MKRRLFDIIRRQALDLQIIFNKASVMVLPSGIDKGTGLTHGMTELGFSLDNTIGIGDAENDHAFLSLCGYSVAVANALGSLKKRVNLVTYGTRGSGVAELIDQVLQDEVRPPVFLPGFLKP
jgi:hydroxymethylpyrimidine pyrophosphatase-like HAD family hydrolase